MGPALSFNNSVNRARGSKFEGQLDKSAMGAADLSMTCEELLIAFNAYWLVQVNA